MIRPCRAVLGMDRARDVLWKDGVWKLLGMATGVPGISK